MEKRAFGELFVDEIDGSKDAQLHRLGQNFAKIKL